MERSGGFITLDDLNRYEVTVTRPIYSDYRDYTIASNHPPGGGVTILQTLEILEGYDLAAMGYLTPEYVYTVSMAMKAAWTDRANLGHDINRLLASYGGIASVHGIVIAPETGKLDGGADPGGGGMALSVAR